MVEASGDPAPDGVQAVLARQQAADERVRLVHAPEPLLADHVGDRDTAQLGDPQRGLRDADAVPDHDQVWPEVLHRRSHHPHALGCGARRPQDRPHALWEVRELAQHARVRRAAVAAASGGEHPHLVLPAQAVDRRRAAGFVAAFDDRWIEVADGQDPHLVPLSLPCSTGSRHGADQSAFVRIHPMTDRVNAGEERAPCSRPRRRPWSACAPGAPPRCSVRSSRWRSWAATPAERSSRACRA